MFEKLTDRFGPTRHRARVAARAGLACLALLLAFAPAASAAIEAKVYGNGVTLEESTRIADILADPDSFIGKTVRVEGGVIDVCAHKGCWIEIGDDERSLQIKVEDDVIVFPAEAKGRIATAQGVVEAVEMTRDSYLAWLAHRAEEQGEPFDADAAEIGDGPFRMIRIRGTGARIE